MSFGKVKQAVVAANEMKRINGELAALQDRIKSGKASPEDRSRVDALNAELEALKKVEPAIEESNTKRLLYASQLAGKLKQLEKLRAIAAGEASIDILKSDKDLNEARLKDAEKLRDALRDAYQSTKKDAISAADEAIKLLDREKLE